MTKNKGYHFSKKISNLKKKEKKNFFNEVQESINVFLLKRKFKSKKREEDHTSQNSGTTEHPSFKI